MQKFTGKKLTIGFDETICIHSGNCVARLPAVFDPERTPWIDPDQGGEEALRAVVKACPSGALKIEVTGRSTEPD